MYRLLRATLTGKINLSIYEYIKKIDWVKFAIPKNLNPPSDEASTK